MKTTRSLFGLLLAAPSFFYAPPDDKGGAGDEGDGVPGETPIDWGDFEASGDGGDGAGETQNPPPGEKPTEEPPAAPAKGEEPAKPEKKTEAPAKPPEPPAAKKGEPEKEKPVGEPPAKPEAAKKTETPKKEEPKTPPATPDIPTTEAELDKIRPKSENPKIVNDFDRLREAARQAIRAKAEIVEKELAPLKQELETLKAKAGEAPEELKKEVEELRSFRQMTLLESDPALQAEFSAKMSKADEAVLNVLTKQLNLSPEKAETMKKNGLDAYSEDWWNEQVLSKIPNPLLRRKMEDALLAREGVKAEKAQRLQEISANRDEFFQKRTQEEQTFWTNYSSGIEKEVDKLAADNPWAKKFEIPADASPEEKARLEAHNADFQKRADEFIATVNKIATHDPVVTAHTVFRAMKLAQVEADLAAAKSESEERQKRIEELEADIAGAIESGRVPSKAGAPPKTPEQKKAAERTAFQERQFEGKEVSVDEAFDAAGI